MSLVDHTLWARLQGTQENCTDRLARRNGTSTRQLKEIRAEALKLTSPVNLSDDFADANTTTSVVHVSSTGSFW